MKYFNFSPSSLLSIAGALSLFALAQPAAAVVLEPNGLAVPQPLSDDLTGCPTCGATEANMGIQSLFNYLGDTGVHWQDAASLDPQVFSPLCGFSGKLLLRGGGCKVDFGWYNVDPANPNRIPTDAEIYPLVSAEAINTLYGANAFWPRVPVGGAPCTDPPTCSAAAASATPDARWAPVQGELLSNIRNMPNYLGGLIGFAVRGNPAEACSQSKFSQHQLNQLCTACAPQAPWISAVVYKSQAIPNAFYIAFEDLPTSADLFDPPTPQGYMNDGDFNDFVYLVQGVTCEGGGTPCSTGSEGACGFGLSECLPNGTGTVCVPQIAAGPETCDNIDNDCNGMVDDGDALCSPGLSCFQGRCVGSCSTGEFPCPIGLDCDQTTGKCIDAACATVTCAAEQVCINGLCLGGCEGVQCPLGQACNLGRCVDRCRDKTCDAGKVCEGGICVENCTCRVCPEGWACSLGSGQCVVQGCESGVTCPAGQVCIYGVCHDACEGVTCPGGANCTAGECGTPVEGFTPDPTAAATSTPYAIPPVEGGPPGPQPVTNPALVGTTADGCGCRVASGPRSPAPLALALIGLSALLFRRRSWSGDARRAC